MAKTAGHIASLYGLASCTECGKCGSVCPSGRNGGVYPNVLVSEVRDASPSSELQADVWKCLMCHRCSSACPKGIDITGLIRSLRYGSAELPKRFRMASDALAEHGRAFPVNENVNRKRSELDLNEIEKDAGSVDELRTIISMTGFRYE